MPDPEGKDCVGKLTEYGQGVFVTEAMMKQIRGVTELVERDVCLSTKAMLFKVPDEDAPSLAHIAERLDRIERLINHIFDGHVLINGRFRRIAP